MFTEFNSYSIVETNLDVSQHYEKGSNIWLLKHLQWKCAKTCNNSKNITILHSLILHVQDTNLERVLNITYAKIYPTNNTFFYKIQDKKMKIKLYPITSS